MTVAAPPCPSRAVSADGRLAVALAGRAATVWVVAAFSLLSLVLVVALSLEPPAAGAQTLLLFAPGTGQADALAAVAAHGGRLVDAGAAGGLFVAVFDRAVGWAELADMGVWAAFAPDSLLGCLAAQAFPPRP